MGVGLKIVVVVFLIYLSNPVNCMNHHSCCYMFIPHSKFAESTDSISRCVELCAQSDKFAAIGNLTYSFLNVLNRTNTFNCYCLLEFEECIPVPILFCFSRMDRERPWFPTGGMPLVYSIYMKCQDKFFGANCQSFSFCRSQPSPTSGFCSSGSCIEGGIAESSNLETTCPHIDCEGLSGNCRSICLSNNNVSKLECFCDHYARYDETTGTCKPYDSCVLHDCNTVECVDVRGSRICECRGSDVYSTFVYGFPFCRKNIGPCKQDHCPDGECHENGKGKAVCRCSDGDLPDDTGSCVEPIVLPALTNCHGYLNQGFSYTCLCHVGYSATSSNVCKLQSIISVRVNQPCQTLIQDTYEFCVCRDLCDRTVACGNSDRCSLPIECKKCQIESKTLMVNGVYGGRIFVDNFDDPIILKVMGPKEVEEGEEIFLGTSAGGWQPRPSRSFNHTPAIDEQISVKLVVRGEEYTSYPINFERMQPLLLNYNFTDGFKKLLDVGFGNYIMRIQHNFDNDSLTFMWYCSRMFTDNFMTLKNQLSCYEGKTFYHEGFHYDFNEADTQKDVGSSYYNYYIYVVPLYRGDTLPHIVKRITVKSPSSLGIITIECVFNCDTQLDTYSNFSLKVVSSLLDEFTGHTFTWILPPGDYSGELPVDLKTLTLSAKQVRQIKDGNSTFDIIVYNMELRISQHSSYSVMKIRNYRKNCSISPDTGYGLVTKFTVTCNPGYNVKIMSGLCGKRRDVILLKFKGTTDEPIKNLVFSIGDPHDYYYKCVYVIDDALVDDYESIKFKVIKNITYVTNFQYLGNLRMDSLSTIIVIGNAIEFFNDNPATDDLDISFRVKCRELLLNLIMEKWNKLEDQLLEIESIKLIYLLLANPVEMSPLHVVRNIYLYEMIDASKLWVPDHFNLTSEEFSEILLYLTECLSYILFSANIRYNETLYEESTEILSYVLDNLAYLGNYYSRQVKRNQTLAIHTSVFTLYLKKFDIDMNRSLEFEINDNEDTLKVEIPSNALSNLQVAEVTMKLVVFPFNPLALSVGSLFTPTVSISLFAVGSYLPISNLLRPVKIRVPTYSSEWLTYADIQCEGSTDYFLGLAPTFFNNTLYKIKVRVKYEQVSSKLMRTEGVLVIVVCKGTPANILLRIRENDHSDCFEVAFKRVNFFRKAEHEFNITLPPMFVLQRSSGLLYKFIGTQETYFTISFSMIQFSCQYWYQPAERSSYGCSISPTETSDLFLVCNCYHLSVFSTESFTGFDNDVSNLYLKAIVDESVHFTLIMTIGSMWVFFIIFGFWAKRQDKLLAIQAYPVDLADNYPNAEYVYLVAVETGIRPYAGNDGTCFIVLIGTLNKSLSHRLACKRYRALQTGTQNYFLIRTSEPLGKITQIRLWVIDETLSGRKINWYLNQVTVFDLQFRDAYVFICDEWMGVNMKGLSNDMTFYAATSLMLNEFNNIFTMNFFKGFVENHVWFSIFTNPILSRFTRFQRVATCMLNTQLYLLTTLLFQKFQRPTARSGTVFYTISKDVALTIFIGLLMSPLFWFFDVLFSQSRKRKTTSSIISDWNRNIGIKKKEKDEDQEQFQEEFNIGHMIDNIINFFTKLCRSAGGGAPEYRDEDDDKSLKDQGFANLTQLQHLLGSSPNTTFSPVTTPMTPNSNMVNNLPLFHNFTRHNRIRGESRLLTGGGQGHRPSNQIGLTNSVIRAPSRIESLDSFKTEYDTSPDKSPKPTAGPASDIFGKNLPTPEAMFGGDKAQLLMKTLIEQRGGKLKRKMKKYHVDSVEGHLPWWMNTVAWIFLSLTIVVCSIVTVTLLIENINEITGVWYSRVSITLLANIFIIDPICIVVGAFFRSLVSRQYINFPLGRLGIMKKESLNNLNHYYDYHKRRVYKLRQSPFYKSPIVIKKKVKVEKKMQHSKSLLLNIILWNYLTMCCLVISVSIYISSTINVNKTISKVIFGQKFAMIRERDDYFDWLGTDLIPILYDTMGNFALRTKMFSRALNFQELPSMRAYAINYPCFTRLISEAEFSTFYADPEWYEFETVCWGYSRKLAQGTLGLMRSHIFLNFNYITLGSTFYLYFPVINVIAWVFITANHPIGGGFTALVDEIFAVSLDPIPMGRYRVIFSFLLFWPAFLYFIFRNMKTFFYVGPGHYFSNMWNILDLFCTFLVLMICILYAFVIDGIDATFTEFYKDHGNLYVSFYYSGVGGILILIHTLCFIIIIRLIELFQLNHLQRVFQVCVAHSLKMFCLLSLKFGCIFLGLVYFKMVHFASYKVEYTLFRPRIVYFFFDMIHTRKIFNISKDQEINSFLVITTALFSCLFRGLIICDGIIFYDKTRRYLPQSKELRNLIEYFKALFITFMKWGHRVLWRKKKRVKKEKKAGTDRGSMLPKFSPQRLTQDFQGTLPEISIN